MRIKLHHVNLCSKNAPAMDAFYRSVLGMEPESSLSENRETGQGYAGKVSFVTDAQRQLHLAEKDLGVAFPRIRLSIRLSVVSMMDVKSEMAVKICAKPACCWVTAAAFKGRSRV